MPVHFNVYLKILLHKIKRELINNNIVKKGNGKHNNE